MFPFLHCFRFAHLSPFLSRKIAEVCHFVKVFEVYRFRFTCDSRRSSAVRYFRKLFPVSRCDCFRRPALKLSEVVVNLPSGLAVDSSPVGPRLTRIRPCSMCQQCAGSVHPKFTDLRRKVAASSATVALGGHLLEMQRTIRMGFFPS